MFEAWSPKSEVQSLKSEVWSLKSGVWSLKSEVRSPKSEVWSLKSEAQNKNPYRRAAYVGSFEASVLAHVALHMLADTLHRWVTLLLLIFILSVWSPKSEVWSTFTASVDISFVSSLFVHVFIIDCCSYIYVKVCSSAVVTERLYILC
jgi:hypothetical protein